MGARDDDDDHDDDDDDDVDDDDVAALLTSITKAGDNRVGRSELRFVYGT